MARKKTKTKSRTKPARPAARAKAKPARKGGSPAGAKAPRSRAGGKGAPGSDVERRWNEYWACRTKLEAAVERVKTARDALQEAQDAERTCRSDFQTIKGSLTELLDVEPAGGPQRQPSPMPARQVSTPQGLPTPQAVQGPKPAS